MGTLYPTHKPNTDLYQGKLTNGIPAAGIPASVLDADFLNLLTDNLEEAIKAAGLEPNNSTDSAMQLKYAIELLARQSWNAGIVYAKGQQILHGELRYLCLQDHTATAANAPGSADGDAFWAEQKTSAEQEAYARSQDSSLRSELQDRFYPIGSIYSNSAVATNPSDSSLLGYGTWAALPNGYAVATSGDGLRLGGTVLDQMQDHHHYTYSSSTGHNNILYHNRRDCHAGGNDNIQRSFGAVREVYNARAGSVTRGKRFGAAIWQRVG